MKSEWSGLEVKSINVLVSVRAISMGVGAEPRLPRSLFCREGHFPRLQQSSVLVVGRKGKRECAGALPRPRERRPLVGLSPSGAWESGVRCGAFCAKERLLPTRSGPRLAPELSAVTSVAYSFLLSLNAHTCADALTQTETP